MKEVNFVRMGAARVVVSRNQGFVIVKSKNLMTENTMVYTLREAADLAQYLNDAVTLESIEGGITV